jgi:hypothetical protein
MILGIFAFQKLETRMSGEASVSDPSETNPKFKLQSLKTSLFALVIDILNIGSCFELIPNGMLRPDFACLRRSGFAQAGASNL